LRSAAARISTPRRPRCEERMIASSPSSARTCAMASGMVGAVKVRTRIG